MRFETTFDDFAPERLMVMRNAGDLSSEQVAFMRLMYEEREFDGRAMKAMEDAAGILGFEYSYITRKYKVFHTKPAHPRDLFFIGVFRHRYEVELWRRCPGCGAWFISRDKRRACSRGCRCKMDALAAAGIVSLKAHGRFA